MQVNSYLQFSLEDFLMNNTQIFKLNLYGVRFKNQVI